MQTDSSGIRGKTGGAPLGARLLKCMAVEPRPKVLGALDRDRAQVFVAIRKVGRKPLQKSFQGTKRLPCGERVDRVCWK